MTCQNFGKPPENLKIIMRAARKMIPGPSMIITLQNKTESAVAGQTHPAAKARNFDTSEILTKCQNFECQNFKTPENQDRMSSEKITKKG